MQESKKGKKAAGMARIAKKANEVQTQTVFSAKVYAANEHGNFQIAATSFPIPNGTTLKQAFGLALQKLCLLVPAAISQPDKKVRGNITRNVEGRKIVTVGARKAKASELQTVLFLGNEQLTIYDSVSIRTPYSDSPESNRTFIFKLLEGFQRVKLANGATLETGAKFLDVAADRLSKGQRITKAQFQTQLAQTAAASLDMVI